MSDQTCAALSAAADEPLGGTASRADAYLLLEVRGVWERDALDSLPERPAAVIHDWLDATPRSKVLLIRRPDRRGDDLAAFVVRAGAAPPTIRRFRLSHHDDLLDMDLDAGGDPVAEPIALVCGHGKRDACCALLGRPLYDALLEEFDPESLWLSSHQGGHRFAPNLLWLPDGLLFGRVESVEAAALVGELRKGWLPVERLRGRTTFPPLAQAAEIAVRLARGIAGLRDVELRSVEDGRARLDTPAGEVEVTVETDSGPPLPPSCGAEPERADGYVVTSIVP